MSGSSILKSFFGYDQRNVEIIAKKNLKYEDDDERNRILVKAAELVVNAKEAGDPASLYFEAAVLFDSIQM